MKRFLMIMLPVCLSLLSGCAHIKKTAMLQSRDGTYLQAKSIEPLRIPPGMSSSSFRNDYPISDRTYVDGSKNVSVIPPGLMVKEK